jgi:AI-2 transport protein TqsA
MEGPPPTRDLAREAGSVRVDCTVLRMSNGPDAGVPERSPLGALPRGLVVLLGTAAAVITGAGISELSWLIGPVFLALIIVIVVSPLQGWLLRHGVPRWAATATLILAVYAVLVALGVVLVISVAQLASLLPEYGGRVTELIDNVTDALARLGIGPEQLNSVAQSVDLGRLADVLGSILAALGNLGSNLVFVLTLLLFLTLEATHVEGRMARIAEDRPQVAAALNEFARGTRSYIVVATIIGLCTGVLDGIILAILGVPLPVLWGLLAFITNYVPNIGFVLGLIPPALLALLDDGWQLMLVVIGVYMVINFVLESLLQPRFVGHAVGLSITVTFLALLFWSWLIGPLGAVLAIPLTLLAKALLIDIDPRANWAGALIGSRSPRKQKPKPAPVAKSEKDISPGE